MRRAVVARERGARTVRKEELIEEWKSGVRGAEGRERCVGARSEEGRVCCAGARSEEGRRRVMWECGGEG